MKVLRIVLVAYAVCYLAGAVVIFQSGKGGISPVLGAYLIVNALVIIGATIFERGRYKSVSSVNQPGWISTGERFHDEGTGKLMEVRYNPKTGERDYVEVVT